MPPNQLTISPALSPNLCSVLLGSGTEYNTGQTFMNNVTWTYAGPPGTSLSLPFTIEACDWASIVVNFFGCTAGPFPWLQGVPRPLWGPPADFPVTYTTSSLTVAGGPGVAFNTATALVNTHPPFIALLGNPNEFDSFTATGNQYTMQFIVTPVPGVYGLKTWEFSVGPGNERIVVVADLVNPMHLGSA